MDVIDEPAINRPVANRFFVCVCGLAFLFLISQVWRNAENLYTDGRDVPPTNLIEIDINNASAREWSLMPGVGPVLANRIVAERRRNGPFESLDDLSRVKGIGVKILDEMRPYCR